MVTATIAEISAGRIDIRGNQGLVKSVRVNLADDDYEHGINTDEADEALEKAGYVSGVLRWQGTYYKTVVVPLDHPRFASIKPAPPMTAEQNMRVFGNPEGRRWTERERRARADQVKATGKVTGWEKRL